MKLNTTFIVAVGFAILGCKAKEESVDQISGSYVREYSFSVVNPESGATVGMRMVRDTIFIKSIEDKFEVSNHKWAKNDYDKDGWRSLEHADDRPFLTMTFTFDPKDETLTDTNHSFTIHLDLAKKRLSKVKDNKNFFDKVR